MLFELAVVPTVPPPVDMPSKTLVVSSFQKPLDVSPTSIGPPSCICTGGFAIGCGAAAATCCVCGCGGCCGCGGIGGTDVGNVGVAQAYYPLKWRGLGIMAASGLDWTACISL